MSARTPSSLSLFSMLLLVGSAQSALLALGCGADVPRPHTGQHGADDFVQVPYPPPAAAAEVVPSSPGPGAVWLDGQWAWRGRYYVWQRGGWVVPPRGAYFAPWTSRYEDDGTLLFAEGVWRRESDKQKVVPPPVVRPATTPPTGETPEPAIAP